MSKGWHGEHYRHSLAARGVLTRFPIQGREEDIKRDVLYAILSLRDQSSYADSRFHTNNIYRATQVMKGEGEPNDTIGPGNEMNWNLYTSLRLLVEDLEQKGLLSFDDILTIEKYFNDELGAPLHGWNLADIERGKTSHSEFYIVDENNNYIAQMSMWFLDPFSGEVPDWDDEEVYGARKEFLMDVEMADLEEEWISVDLGDMSDATFMRRALPFITKFARDEGIGLEYGTISYDEFDRELDEVMGAYHFDIGPRKVNEPDKYNDQTTYVTRYSWKYRDYYPKVVVHTPEGDVPFG